MTASYIVRYHGSAPDPEGFLAHYRESHAPILQRFPGIGSLILPRSADFTDPHPVTPGGNLLIAEVTFDECARAQFGLCLPGADGRPQRFRQFSDIRR